MTAAAREGWSLEIFAVERDGSARSVWTGPWPAHGDPEWAAFALGEEQEWPGGLYELRLVVGGVWRVRRADLDRLFPAPPPAPRPRRPPARGK